MRRDNLSALVILAMPPKAWRKVADCSAEMISVATAARTDRPESVRFAVSAKPGFSANRFQAFMSGMSRCKQRRGAVASPHLGKFDALFH